MFSLVMSSSLPVACLFLCNLWPTTYLDSLQNVQCSDVPQSIVAARTQRLVLVNCRRTILQHCSLVHGATHGERNAT
jgi:hypothetical protein